MSLRTLTCRQCGATFTAERKRGMPPAYCQQKCREEGHRRHKREHDQRVRAGHVRIRRVRPPKPAKPAVRPSEEITPVQREYLRAFDRWLRSGREEDEQAKDCFLDAMYWERTLLPPSLRPNRTPQHAKTSLAMRLA